MTLEGALGQESEGERVPHQADQLHKGQDDGHHAESGGRRTNSIKQLLVYQHPVVVVSLHFRRSVGWRHGRHHRRRYRQFVEMKDFLIRQMTLLGVVAKKYET